MSSSRIGFAGSSMRVIRHNRQEGRGSKAIFVFLLSSINGDASFVSFGLARSVALESRQLITHEAALW
jgi:hypothetical protein